VSSWSKLLRLSFTEKRLLVGSVVLLPISAVVLRFISLRRFQSFLSMGVSGDWSRRGYLNRSTIATAFETARMVRVASSRGLCRGNCLQRSVTLWWLLRRQNIESHIRFGARKESGKLTAHAWVEVEGLVLDEEAASKWDFTPFRSAVPAEAKSR
jgi:hypothetical protein